MSEEMNALISRAKNDADALLQLWYCVHRYAYKIALKYKGIAQHNGAVDMDDLKQCAFLGFYEAVQRFDPLHGTFFTMLSYCVSTACRRALGMDGRERAEYHVTSLDDPIPGTDDLTLSDTIPDPASADAFEKTEMHRDIEKALDCLPEDMATIIRLHDLQGLSLRETASHFNCNLEELCRRRRNAFYKIRQKRILSQYVRFRHKTLADFQRDWSSVVEDEVIRRLDRRGDFDD